MKKIYSSLGTLMCLSFLFALNSCTTETPFESDDTLVKVDPKKEIQYYHSSKVDPVPYNTKNRHVSARYVHNDLFEAPYVQDSFPASILTYSAQAEVNMAVDPDWKNLITHFIEVDGDTE